VKSNKVEAIQNEATVVSLPNWQPQTGADMFKAVLAVVLASILQVASATPATQVDPLFQGYSLTPYGGPVTDLLLTLKFPADAQEWDASSPYTSIWSADVDITSGGVDIALHDSTGRMVDTDQLGDLQSDFASYVTSFSITERIGGWGPGRVISNDATGASLYAA
jgi:hypothetical protein